MWAIIGGSGFEQFPEFKKIESLQVKTPYGEHASAFCRVSFCGVEILFLPRHGEQHEKLPSEVNYCANVYALKSLGVTKVLSFSAVGSYDLALKPGDAVIPNDYIDLTKGIRANTFCGNGFVAHVSVKKPVHPKLVELLQAQTSEFSFDCHFNKVYVCEEGPHFATLKEALVRKELGYDIVGQTNYPEYVLMKEAGIAYLPVCFVSNYDAWDESVPDLPMPEILAIIRENKDKAYVIARQLLTQYQDVLSDGAKEEGIAYASLTDYEALQASTKARLKCFFN